jgi:Domain of unknown function (DUF4345)
VYIQDILRNISMTTVLQILLGLLGVICFLVSIKLLKNGAKLFTPLGQKLNSSMDNLLRFFGGIMLGLSSIFAWTTITINSQNELIYILGAAILFAAMGRLLSRQTVGAPPASKDFFMYAEFVLGTAVVVCQYFRSHI